MSTSVVTDRLLPGELAKEVLRTWADDLTMGQSAPSKAPYVYASRFRECERRMVLEMTEGDKLPAFDADTLARFRRGDDRERELLSDLGRLGRSSNPGFKLVSQQQRFELKDRIGRVVIVGKVDARLQFNNGDCPPVEVKAWNPNLVAGIECFEDLFKSPWTKGGAYQLLAYLFGSNQPYGFLLLDRSGLPTIISVELYPNLGRMEEFLTRAERAMDHAAAGTLPDYIRDAAECKRCPFFGSVCQPPTSYEGATVLSDPELEAMLDRRQELSEAAEEYETLDKQVKGKLRGITTGVAGRFLIEGKWGSSTTYDIPADLRAQYKRVDPQGRFTLKITPLS